MAWMSAPRTKSWQPQLRIRAAYSGPRLKMPQGLPADLHGLGDRFDRLQALGVLEVAGHAENLAQVGRTDEEQVDVGNGGDLGDRVEGARRLDLNADERLGIGPGRVLGQRDQAEPAVAVAAVQARARPSARTWPSGRPARPRPGADHADHHAPCPGFERAHHRRVIGRRQPDEMVHPVAAGRHRRQLDVLHGQAAVLGVDPEGVEIAVLTQDRDQLGRQKLPKAKTTDDLAFAQQLFDSRHRNRSLPGIHRVQSVSQPFIIARPF